MKIENENMIAKNVYAKNENRNERFFKRFSCRNLQFLFVHLIFFYYVELEFDFFGNFVR